MKKVSFEVAKALKEAGYPQGITQGQYAKTSYYDNELENYIDEGTYTENFIILGIDAPTYLEVWLWLWRERHNFLECVYKEGRFFNYRTSYSYADPEEAIIAAIEHLVNNHLIK